MLSYAYPKPLEDQLKEGGKLIIPVGENYSQELILFTKKKGKLVRVKSIPVLFVPMRNSKGEKY
jgi:protein-L-isoaspartate(D-aspartate) O-methyltransferase